MNRAFISGPMTGRPEFNYPLFNRVATSLRRQNFDVENPAENPLCATWGEYMRLSIRQMLTCDFIVMLPGWWRSRGARIEWLIAKMVGIPVYPVKRFGVKL